MHNVELPAESASHFTAVISWKREQPKPHIQITEDGLYLVTGGLPLREQLILNNAGGESLDYAEGKKYPAQPQYALCRCGRSGHKPFCDGTHAKVHFDGTETASRQPYLEQAETIKGQTYELRNRLTLCRRGRSADKPLCDASHAA